MAAKPLGWAGTLDQALRRAEELARAEKCPAVRVDHLLVALLLDSPDAADVVKVIKGWAKEWERDG